MADSANSSNIAKLLQEAAPPPSKSSKACFWAILIISWCIILGISAVAIYCGIKWKQVATDYKDSYAKIQELEGKVNSQNTTINSLKKQLLEVEEELTHTKTERDALKVQVTKLEEELKNATKLLNETQDALKKEKEEHEKCKEKTKEIEGQYNKLKEEVEILRKNVTELNHTMHQLHQEVSVYKIASIGVLAVSVLGAVDDILTHINLWNREEYLKGAESKINAFPPLARDFVGLELGSKFWGKHITSRTQCNKENDFSKCIVDWPTVTTINTTSGYVFGLVLFTKFPSAGGSASDANAFAFSANHAASGMAHIKDGTVAAITVGKGSILTFGETDVVVFDNGRKIKFQSASNFNYPEIGYPKYYVEGSTAEYEISSLVTEYITLDPK